MAVRVILRGSPGDNLFQIALGHIVANALSLSLRCISGPLTDPDRGPVPSLTDVLSVFDKPVMDLHGTTVTEPTEEFSYRTIRNWDGQEIPLNSIVRNKRPRQLIFDGFFQRYRDYYVSHASLLSQLFARSTAISAVELSPDASSVTLALWRTQLYAARKWLLPLSYYDEAIRRCGKLSQLYICGVGVTDDVKAHFSQYDPVYIDVHPGHLLEVMTKSRRLVIGNATLLWWGAFLSGAGAIYSPVTLDQSVYAFGGYPGVDLNMAQVRYNEIAVQRSAQSKLSIRSTIAGAHLFRSDPESCVVYRQGQPMVSVGLPAEFDGVLCHLANEVAVEEHSLLCQREDGSVRQCLPELVRQGLVTVDWEG
jgi:hypothetical protein